MKQKSFVLVASQVAVIVLTSLAAVYTFQGIHTSIQIAGISAYYYLTYFLAVILCVRTYTSESGNAKSGSVSAILAFLSAFCLLFAWLILASTPILYLFEALPLVSVSPISHITHLLPVVTFSLAVLIGIFSTIVVPYQRSRYSIMFLIMLILPMILAESKVNWTQFSQDLITLSEIYPSVSFLTPLFHIFREGFLLLTNDVRMNLYELFIVCFVVVAGYIYLRCTTQIALTQRELKKRGASAEDVDALSRGILFIAGIAASAIAATSSATVIAPLVVGIIYPLIVEMPVLVFLLGLGMGATAVTAIRIYTQTTAGPLPKKIEDKEPRRPRMWEVKKECGNCDYYLRPECPRGYSNDREVWRTQKTCEIFRPKTDKKPKSPTIDLERVCVDDETAYEALRETMLLDPRIMGISMEESAKKARKAEKEGDIIRARFWYRIAGGLAIYEGDVTKVKRYFGEYAALSPSRSYIILEITERAVSKAQEYYRKNQFF